MANSYLNILEILYIYNVFQILAFLEISWNKSATKVQQIDSLAIIIIPSVFIVGISVAGKIEEPPLNTLH